MRNNKKEIKFKKKGYEKSGLETRYRKTHEKSRYQSRHHRALQQNTERANVTLFHA